MDGTLDYYNSNADAFVQGTVNADVEALRQSFLSYLTENASICDLGCGSGRDSKYFLEKGYQVTAIDGSQSLCHLASEYTGQEVICETFDQFDFQQAFDGVWACASLLHVPLSLLPDILERIARSLKAGGILYVSFKYGSFEGERNGRYFTDMTSDQLTELIGKIGTLHIISMTVSNDVRIGRQNEKWINALIKNGGF